MPYQAYFIPDAPANLASFFPDHDFTLDAEYYLEVLDSGSAVMITTPLIQLNSQCCGEDKVRIHFVNYLGGVDAINFKKSEGTFDTKSDEWRKPEPAPNKIMSQHARNRFNVSANETLDLICSDYPPSETKWIEELLASPLAWIEWPGTEDQTPDYLPVLIVDARTKIFTNNTDSWVNDIPVSITYSYDKVIIRN